MSGILMNRQRKLLVSSLKSYLVRVKKESIRQIEKIQSGDDVRLAFLEGHNFTETLVRKSVRS